MNSSVVARLAERDSKCNPKPNFPIVFGGSLISRSVGGEFSTVRATLESNTRVELGGEPKSHLHIQLPMTRTWEENLRENSKVPSPKV